MVDNDPLPFLHPIEAGVGYEYNRMYSAPEYAAMRGLTSKYVNKHQMPLPSPGSTTAKNVIDAYTEKLIETWPVHSNYTQKDLFRYCKKVWKDPGTLWHTYRGVDTRTDKIYFVVLTGGHERNERVIAALSRNKAAWEGAWLESRNDGRHKFYVKFK